MKIAFVLPSHKIHKSQVDKAIRSVNYRFPNTENIDYICDKSSKELHSSILNVSNIIEKSHMNEYDVVVFLEGRKELFPTSYRACPGQKVYKVDYAGKLNRCGHLTDDDYEHFNTHPFNKLGPRIDDNFYYFPYGYLFRFTGMGPTNEFGHRINIDLTTLYDRDSSHIVVAVYGGSAAWSIYAHFEEMFQYRLQLKLNEYCKNNGLRYKFTVLNFATPGNVILNEILSYTLYSHRLKPDVVIAHDGYNDMCYGQQSSPHLLNKYEMTYQYNLEAWSQILHKTEDRQLGWTKDRVPTINYPRFIVNAYFERQKQFKAYVNANGGIFIAGLQPTIFSKESLSDKEKGWIDYYFPRKEPHKNMTFLYEKYLLKDPGSHLENFVNFHDLFRRFGSDVTLLGDLMHTMPDGDEKISEFYLDYFQKNIFQKLEARRPHGS